MPFDPQKQYLGGQIFRSMVKKMKSEQADENVKMLMVGQQDVKEDFI